MKITLTLLLLVFFQIAFSQKRDYVDSTIVEMKANSDSSRFFYQTNSFAFSISQDDINSLRFVFNRQFYVCLRKMSFPQDTIWINEYIKQKKEQDVKLLCWGKIVKQNACIINMDSNERVKKILYCRIIRLCQNLLSVL